MRFERATDTGWVSLFPEVYSFHLDRHEPFELYLQLEDLWSDPHRLGEAATRRDAQDLVRRLLALAPAYLEGVLRSLAADERFSDEGLARLHGDALVLIRALHRLVLEKELGGPGENRFTAAHLRKLAWLSARELVGARVSDAELESWLSEPRDATPLSDRGLLRAAAGDGNGARLLPLAEVAYHAWLEDVCLDEGRVPFDTERAPFETLEQEILDAVVVGDDLELRRASGLSPFLRRKGNRDCMRLLRKLEVWFLRQYDVPRAAAVIRHAGNLKHGIESDGVLTRHSTRNYLVAIGLLVSPFLGAAVAYERAPLFFDVLCSLDALLVIATMLWYLLYQFVWRKDLAFFHSSVPRIGAGIIVGYLPVFLIDEVWDLARQPWLPLGVIVALLGFATLLYLHVEVSRRIAQPELAFARARRIFVLGVLQALALGLTMTTLLGSFMVTRTWSRDGELGMEALRAAIPTFADQLPRIVGVAPIYVFPTAILLMTFLSFFIGTFLQLLWEEIAITEPL